ncbi:unnamed protein product [Amoebophrya sp. A120]|nr:unnamed protein product [Amoebophrya sp. A120]|eukprot:GSA120T00013952001.1
MRALVQHTGLLFARKMGKTKSNKKAELKFDLAKEAYPRTFPFEQVDSLPALWGQVTVRASRNTADGGQEHRDADAALESTSYNATEHFRPEVLDVGRDENGNVLFTSAVRDACAFVAAKQKNNKGPGQLLRKVFQKTASYVGGRTPVCPELEM